MAALLGSALPLFDRKFINIVKSELNRSVDFCMKNIAKRGREGENKISPAYLNGEFQYERIVNVLK